MVRMFVFLFGSRASDRIVPTRGNSAWLTFSAAAAMAFIAVFALALSLAVGRIADRWSLELAQTATVQIIAPSDEIAAQTEAALAVLRTTPGIAAARFLDQQSQAELLAPWLGEDLPIDKLPLPNLIEITVIGDGPESDNLKLRLAAEAPGARFDDHSRWRDPIRKAGNQLRNLAIVSLILVATTTAIIVTLAANSALASSASIIKTLRLIGATDAYIARAFVRRITFRTMAGAVTGTLIAMLAVFPYPAFGSDSIFLATLSFNGWQWIFPVMVPLFAAMTAFFATRFAAARHLRHAA